MEQMVSTLSEFENPVFRDRAVDAALLQAVRLHARAVPDPLYRVLADAQMLGHLPARPVRRSVGWFRRVASRALVSIPLLAG